jgi:predicted membrane metal-binding protein
MTDSASKLAPTQQQELSTSTIPAPPRWLWQIGYWFRIGFSLFLLLPVLIGVAGRSSIAATVPWRKATAVVPEAVIEQVIQTNTDINVAQAKETLLAWSIDGKEGKLTLFNFNTPNLCGALGCLYTGYWLRESISGRSVPKLSQP